MSNGDYAGGARQGMQVVVSLAILGTALYVILSQVYSPQEKHWAYASAGTVLGFWLRGSR